MSFILLGHLRNSKSQDIGILNFELQMYRKYFLWMIIDTKIEGFLILESIFRLVVFKGSEIFFNPLFGLLWGPSFRFSFLLQHGCPKGQLSPITFLSKLGAITIITIRDSLTHGSRAKSSTNWVQH